MSPIRSKVEPRYLVFSRSEPRPYHLPEMYVHRVEVIHDDTSPRPQLGRRQYEGYAVYDVARNRLVRLFVYQEPEHVLTEWRLPLPDTVMDIPVLSTQVRPTLGLFTTGAQSSSRASTEGGEARD